MNAKDFALFLLMACIHIYAFTQPTITSFTPTSGHVGIRVTIKGTNFNSTPANNIVYFGAVRATVLAASDTSVTVTVPAGAAYEPISVLNTSSGLTGYSTKPFIVTFYGGAGSRFVPNSFAPKVDIKTGTGPYSVVTGDLDGDGKSDLVVANREAKTVSIFRNTSTAATTSFASKKDYSTGDNNPSSIALGDLDGDGKLDLAVTTYDGVLVFRNISSGGNISFAAKVDLDAGYGLTSLAIGDLDGNGRADLVVANSDYGVSVLRNASSTGSISFGPKIDYNSRGIGANDVSIGDLDDDGKPDIVVACAGGYAYSSTEDIGAVTILRNTSIIDSISFAEGVVVSEEGYFSGVSIGDLDADGKPDLAVSDWGPDSPHPSGSLFVFKNTSTSDTMSFIKQGNYPVIWANDVLISDLEGDGKPDLVVTRGFLYSSDSTEVAVFKNTSTRSNISFAQREDYLAGVSSYSASVGDLDRDGRPDLAIVNYSGNTVSVLRNQVTAPYIASFNPIAAGKPGTPVTIKGINFSGATEVNFGSIPAASFNVQSDTSITAIAGRGATGSIAVTTPEGTDSLAGFTYTTKPFIFSFTPLSGEAGTTVTITGINFTGATEVNFGGVVAASFTVESDTIIKAVVGAGTAGSVTITTALGTGTLAWFTFEGVPVITSFTPAHGRIGTVVTINGKNFNDTAENNIVYVGAVKATVSNATNSSLMVWIPSAGAYHPTTVLNKANGLIGYSGEPFAMTTQDGGNPITDSSFASRIKYSTGIRPTNVSTADFNADGKLDIIVTNSTYNTVSIYRNIGATGTISFAERISYATGHNPASIATGDLDGDGKPDLVVANAGDQTISVFRNTSENGIIFFATKADYIAGTGPNSVAIGDLDADGKPDLVVASYNSGYIDSGKISVFKNFSTPGTIFFASKVDYPTSTNAWSYAKGYPNSVSLGDLNGDGKPEIVVANFYYVDYNDDYYSAVTIFKNTSTSGVLSFTYPVDYDTYPAIDVIAEMTMGDLDADHKPDLAVLDEGGYVAIFKNTGTDSTISFAPTTDYYWVGYYPTELAIGDLNGDGKPDIAGASFDGVSVLRNTGNNGNISFAEAVFLTLGDYAESVSIGDFDADGKSDLATVNSELNTLSIWKNRVGGASFAVTPKFAYTGKNISFTTLTTMATSWQWDFDGDGIFDSEDKNPQHIYFSGGLFKVNLRINHDPLSDKIIPITILPDRGTPYTLADGGDFETNINDFAADNTGSSSFSLGNSEQPGKDSTHSGLNAWVLDIDTPTYTDTATAYLYTPSFNCTAKGDYTISFYAKYNVENAYDGFRIAYSTDKGNTWYPLGTKVKTNWYDYDNPDGDRPFPQGQAYFSLHDANTYTKKTFTTRVFEGNSTVAFRFVFKSDLGTDEAGLAIDDFTLTGPTNVALPVNLISFSAYNSGDRNILNWKTATEINSGSYEIERSIDGHNFEKVGSVKSANNPTGSSYRYDDNISHIYTNNFYYKLKIIDNDGGYTYSNIVSINVHGGSEKILVLGNLTGSYINVVTPASILSKPLQAEILNLSGVVIKRVTIANTSSIIYVNTLASGKYYIRFIQGEKIIQTEQFVKQ